MTGLEAILASVSRIDNAARQVDGVRGTFDDVSAGLASASSVI